MKRICWFFLFAVLLVSMLAGCSQPSIVIETVTATKIANTPTLVKTLTPIQTLTVGLPTDGPIRVIQPTKTSTPIPSSTPLITLTFTTTPTPSPTHDRAGQRLLSPDGQFIAKTYGDYFSGEFRNWTEISNVSTGQVLWTIPEQKGDPGPNYELYQWAFDSSKLYYYLPFRYDGGVQPLWNGRDLHSIDIISGEIKIILSIDYLASFGLSQNAPLIASYLSGLDPQQTHIRD